MPSRARNWTVRVADTHCATLELQQGTLACLLIVAALPLYFSFAPINYFVFRILFVFLVLFFWFLCFFIFVRFIILGALRFLLCWRIQEDARANLITHLTTSGKHQIDHDTARILAYQAIVQAIERERSRHPDGWIEAGRERVWYSGLANYRRSFKSNPYLSQVCRRADGHGRCHFAGRGVERWRWFAELELCCCAFSGAISKL